MTAKAIAGPASPRESTAPGTEAACVHQVGLLVAAVLHARDGQAATPRPVPQG